MSTLGGIFSPVSGMRGRMYFNEIYHSYLLPGTYNTDDICKVIRVQTSRSQTTLAENALLMVEVTN